MLEGYLEHCNSAFSALNDEGDAQVVLDENKGVEPV